MCKLQMCIANACSKCVKIESSRAGWGVVVFLLKLKRLNLSNKKLPFIALGQRVGVVSGIIASQHRRLQVNVVFSFPYNRIIINAKKAFVLVKTSFIAFSVTAIISPFGAVWSQIWIIVRKGYKRTTGAWLDGGVFSEVLHSSFSMWITFSHNVKCPSCRLLSTKVSYLREVYKLF